MLAVTASGSKGGSGSGGFDERGARSFARITLMFMRSSKVGSTGEGAASETGESVEVMEADP
jgi:hypothetical protein